MKSPLIKRSVVVNRHKTSISLEDAFWIEIKAIASAKKTTVADLITNIDRDRRDANLSFALRVFVLRHHQAACWERLVESPDQGGHARDARRIRRSRS